MVVHGKKWVKFKIKMTSIQHENTFGYNFQLNM